MVLAEKYHQAPHEVETWPEYWHNRAVKLMEGEYLEQKRKDKERAKKR